MNNTTKISIAAIVIVCLSLSLSLYAFFSQPKVTCINLTYVYGKFEYKVEMEGKLESVANARTHVLDSLKMQLRVLANNINSSEKKQQSLIDTYKAMEENYLIKQKEFQEDNANLANQYNEQVLSQLNQYVEDFAKEKKYDIILGSTGDGNVMHINDTYNVSDEVITYINNRYAGK